MPFAAKTSPSPSVRRALVLLGAAALAMPPTLVPMPAAAQAPAHPRYDYPTAARADYVIGCLAANGFHHELLQKCSCGIDVIANEMPYDDYEKANTILSMQKGGAGPRAGLFRTTPIAREELKKLRKAEADVNLTCG